MIRHPDEVPRILVFGGVDPTGGAGVTTDVRMAHAVGVEAAPIVTCLTVQNRHGFLAKHPVDEAIISDTVRAVLDDAPIHAVKLGLLGDVRRLEMALGICEEFFSGLPVIVDPVLGATAGGLEIDQDLVQCYRRCVTPITLLTPNLPELKALAPEGVDNLVASGCANVLVSGGHGVDREVVEDHLHSASGVTVFRHPRHQRGPIHGTGCAMATGIAARIALGFRLEQACEASVEHVADCVEATRNSPDGLPVPLVISASKNPA